MRQQAPNHLSKELKAAGASSSEVRELMSIAGSLKHLKSPGSPAPAQERSRLSSLLPYGLTGLSGFALGLVLVIFSQTVLPGSWLYPVQALSDHVAVSVDTGYRGTVMMKRAQQVKQLIAENANSGLVLATLGDYKNEAALYKSSSANYAAFEYCKTSLQQAAAIAPHSERQAINATLSSLSNV